MTDQPDVVVITGAGGMGAAIARRIGSGHTVLLADAFAEPPGDGEAHAAGAGDDHDVGFGAHHRSFQRVPSATA